VHLLVHSVLFVVDCASFDTVVCGKQCSTYIRIVFLITLQEKIDTVTVGVESVGEEDCIKIKTEDDFIQLVRVIKTEQEVSVLCSCVMW